MSEAYVTQGMNEGNKIMEGFDKTADVLISLRVARSGLPGSEGDEPLPYVCCRGTDRHHVARGS